jgi:hypothetical protein
MFGCSKNNAQLVIQSSFIEAASDRPSAFSLIAPNSNPALLIDIYNHRESPLSLSLIRHYRILEWTSSPVRVVQSHKFLEIVSEVLKRPIDLNLPFVDDKFLLTSHIPTETVTGKRTYHMRQTALMRLFRELLAL